MTIAEGHFAGDARVTFVTADLKDPDWRAALPHGSFDAILTATALHWLPSADLAVLYGQLAPLLAPGGVFMNADHMPDPTTPRIDAAEHAHRHAGMDRAKTAGAVDWREWWALAGAEPALAEQVKQRFEIYGEHADGDTLRGLARRDPARRGLRGGPYGLALPLGRAGPRSEVGTRNG